MMQSQAQPHPNVKWLTAQAEEIPLADHAVDAAVIMLALHHFDELSTGIEKLTKDINSGAWDHKYGELRKQNNYDAGYRIIVAKNK